MGRGEDILNEMQVHNENNVFENKLENNKLTSTTTTKQTRTVVRYSAVINDVQVLHFLFGNSRVLEGNQSIVATAKTIKIKSRKKW